MGVDEMGVVTVESRQSGIKLLCSDYSKNYSRPIEILYFHGPINIILSADWSNYIKDSTISLISHKNFTIGR